MADSPPARSLRVRRAVVVAVLAIVIAACAAVAVCGVVVMIGAAALDASGLVLLVIGAAGAAAGMLLVRALLRGQFASLSADASATPRTMAAGPILGSVGVLAGGFFVVRGLMAIAEAQGPSVVTIGMVALGTIMLLIGALIVAATVARESR